MNLALKKVRESRGVTQSELAERLGMKVATYRTWEQGTVKLTLENACRISFILNCTPNDLCDWYHDHPQDRPKGNLPLDVAELEDCYRSCTPERRGMLLNLARDSALVSGEAAERAVHADEASA